MDSVLVRRERKEAAMLWISVASGLFQSCQEGGWQLSIEYITSDPRRRGALCMNILNMNIVYSK
jgi:hypothetical protein